jgi:hypothetical protein
MGRIIAIDAVFFLLPFAIYAAWLAFTKGSLSDVEDWQAKTIGYLAIAGAGVLLAAIAVFVQLQNNPAGSGYVPAHIEDGQIVPGHAD